MVMPQQRPTPRWEYKTTAFPPDEMYKMALTLNGLGEHGWEAVGVSLHLNPLDPDRAGEWLPRPPEAPAIATS
jgi:hypothetical protein